MKDCIAFRRFRVAGVGLCVLLRAGAADVDSGGAGDRTLSDSQFAMLASRAPLRSMFVETRFFSFRKTPVVLKGEMRFAPDLGLSLSYVEPKERIMIVDSAGIVLRDDRGRSREMPRDARHPSADAVLLPILGFDLPVLRETFEIDMDGTSEAWNLRFTPREDALRREVGEVLVSGHGDKVDTLEFRRSASQRVEIAVGQTETNIDFSPAERERFFR